jgi:hypothetical protein
LFEERIQVVYNHWVRDEVPLQKALLKPQQKKQKVLQPPSSAIQLHR